MTLLQVVDLAYRHWNASQNAQAEQIRWQVLQAAPEHPSALHLVGLLAFMHGNLARAIDYIRRACMAPSAPATFHSNLAEICRQAGRMTEAEAAARRTLAIDPQLSAGWTNLGIIPQESGNSKRASAALSAALAVSPSPENHNNIGNALNEWDASPRRGEGKCAAVTEIQLLRGAMNLRAP